MSPRHCCCCLLLPRDARRLDVFRKPDGTPPDLPRKADLLVQEAGWVWEWGVGGIRLCAWHEEKGSPRLVAFVCKGGGGGGGQLGMLHPIFPP